MDNQPRHTMRTAAKLSGISPHVIRIWERRYNAVTPARSETDRRLYSAQDVERLTLLRRAKEFGHSIGQIAQLPTDELAALVGNQQTESAPPDAGAQARASGAEQVLEESYSAVQALDPAALEAALERAIVALGQIATLQHVVAPLMQRIGENWRGGQARVGQEHMAAATVRKFLSRLIGSTHEGTAPLIVVTTPARQIHELGALMAAATADSAGWRVLYLGANLPAEEIAAASLQSQARAVALSIIYPHDDPRLPEELTLLRRHLPAETAVLVGGRGTEALRPLLESLQFTPVSSIIELRDFLEKIREPEYSSSRAVSDAIDLKQ